MACGEFGIGTHTMSGSVDHLESCDCTPIHWNWQYRVVAIAAEASNPNLSGRGADPTYVIDATMRQYIDGVPGGIFGGTSGMGFYITKTDLGMGTYDTAGSWSGYRTGDWMSPVGVEPPGVKVLRLYSSQQFDCGLGCYISITWRLEVKDEFGVILNPDEAGGGTGVGVPGGPPGAFNPCNCPPFTGTTPEVPVRNQPVINETAGTGNGSTTVYTTAFPYVPNSLRVEVAGFVVPIDTTSPSAGTFTVLDVPPNGELISASYKAS